jgi:hypothetical protein
LFVLTHHPEDAEPVDGVTFLDCDVAEAVRIGLDAADGTRLYDVADGSMRKLQNLGRR